MVIYIMEGSVVRLESGTTVSLGAVLKVLAEPNRLHILFALGTECRPVTDIIQATDLPQTNVSFHLRILREAGLVRAERRGAFIYYCLPDPELLAILRSLQAWMGIHAHVLPSPSLPNVMKENAR